MDNKEKKYKELYSRISSVLSTTEDMISSMATTASLIKESFPELLWVGFYRVIDKDLFVAPYQGTLGCTFIKCGKGVCGSAQAAKKTLIIPDVHKFEGHIACDSRARSEIVVPVFDISGKVVAVLDIDSSDLSTFDEIDKNNLENIVKLLSDKRIIV